MQTGQILTQANKERRISKPTKLLNKLKHPKKLWFFSDVTIFCQDQAQNRQNNKWIAMCPKDVPRVIKIKSTTIMVFHVISSDGDAMLPHIFETGLRVNTEIYLQVTKIVVLPWIKQVARDSPWVWQQDSAPFHVSKCSLSWLKNPCYNLTPKMNSLLAVQIQTQWIIFFWGILDLN